MSRDAVGVAIGQLEELLCRGLLHAIGDDPRLSVLGAGLDGATLAKIVSGHPAPVAILDEFVGHSLLMQLKARQPRMEIFVLSRNPTLLYRTMLLAAGATCLPTDTPVGDILDAVHRAASHNSYEHSQRDSPEDRAHGAAALTRRESEVAEYLARGKSYAEIALALQIGAETVRTHAKRVCEKLGVSNKLDLVVGALPARSVGVPGRQ